jgi:hypothetical protein
MLRVVLVFVVVVVDDDDDDNVLLIALQRLRIAFRSTSPSR